ncbi:protein DOG1-like 4 [Cynara cardunculus var. scolymus]|uniref:protein DOG1-like 4 n=1 Tax=Cynara cardunculus var. scolymus TaxID=59895 RepID=UPI000D6299C5|nr:protein DOG1-like 4 [Cynara cardunculus var. scolymus]
MPTNTLQAFTAFYDGWLLRHHHLQQQLFAAGNGEHNQPQKLVQQVSDHYRQYYQEKSVATEQDVFLICSPPWHTSFEQALFWVTEYPPSLLFRFLNDLDLTTDQAERIEAVRVETVRKEREIGETMAMVQESAAAAPLYGLVNRTGTLVDGQVSELDDAMEEVKEAMRMVMAEADGLRGRTVAEILEGLEVMQKVKFFAAVGEFRIRARRVGLEMDRAGRVRN